MQTTYFVIILTGHDIGEGDLGLEHLPTVHQLYQQVTHGLKLHPLGWFDVGQNQTWKDLEINTEIMRQTEEKEEIKALEKYTKHYVCHKLISHSIKTTSLMLCSDPNSSEGVFLSGTWHVQVYNNTFHLSWQFPAWEVFSGTFFAGALCRCP